MKRPRVHVRFRGLADLSRKLEAMSREAGHAAGSGVLMLAEMIKTDINASRPGRGVPKRDGFLMHSGRVEGPNAKGSVFLIYGNAQVPYALYQHERTDLHHKLGESRYIVRGVERAAAMGSANRALREVGQAVIARGRSA